MKVKVFAIYDSKAECYGPAIQMRSTGEALRAFADLANDDRTETGKHPEDFTLFEIATYDNEKAVFQNYTTPNSLAVAIELKRPDPNRILPGMEIVKEKKDDKN